MRTINAPFRTWGNLLMCNPTDIQYACNWCCLQWIRWKAWRISLKELSNKFDHYKLLNKILCCLLMKGKTYREGLCLCLSLSKHSSHNVGPLGLSITFLACASNNARSRQLLEDERRMRGASSSRLKTWQSRLLLLVSMLCHSHSIVIRICAYLDCRRLLVHAGLGGLAYLVLFQSDF